MKQRALMIIHNFRPGPVGGAELQAERLAAHLAQLGHSMQILTWLTVPDAPQEEIRDNVKIRRVPYRLPYWVKLDNARTFRYLVKQRQTYDVLHAHMAFGHAVMSVVVARCFRKKCIVKIACAGEFGDLHTFSGFDGFDKALKILHQADAIVAVSSEVEQELHQYGFPPENIVRIPNGVDTSFFRRAQSDHKPGKTKFIMIGRRHPQKGVDTVLKAAQLLREQGQGDQFEIDSYGIDYPEYDYRTMAKEMGVAANLRFLPFESDIYSIYESAHGFLLPSRGEGLSNSLLEAMAMELPVIASEVSGTSDVVTNGEDGILIPAGSPDALAVAMSAFIRDPDQAKTLGINARKKVENCFSLQSVALRYSGLYDEI